MKAIQRIGNLLIFGGPDWKDAADEPLQTIIGPYNAFTAEITPFAINWHFENSSFLITYADIPTADFSSVADLVNGSWTSNASKVQTLLSEGYIGEKTIEGNHLVVMRKYLTNGKVQTLFETITQQSEALSDCYAIRFVNCGKNTVMIDRLPLDNNEALDIPGEANYTIESKFNIVFDDGTTGREIIKKKFTAEVAAGVAVPADSNPQD